MDDAGHPADVAPAEALTSHEKIQRAIGELAALQPDPQDPAQAGMLVIAQQVAPAAVRLLPPDPGRLDDALLSAARALLALRSDGQIPQVIVAVPDAQGTP